MLDAVFASEDTGNAMGEELGAIVEGSAATFKLWAPTAQDVELVLYSEDLQSSQVIPMTKH